MKKFNILYLLVLLTILAGCDSKTVDAINSIPFQPASTITITPPSYDFGIVNANETKTATFKITTDGFVISRHNNDGNILGFNTDNLTEALNKMVENVSTTQTFNVTFKPVCNGTAENEVFVTTDFIGGASTTFKVTATVNDTSLPACSSTNPVITVTSVPENAIQTKTIQNENGTSSEIKYVDFDTLGQETLNITSTADTYHSGGSSASGNGDFNYNVTSWALNENNQPVSTANITFNKTSCSGPASTRVRINGLSGNTFESDYLYLKGTGTNTSATSPCSNYYANIVSSN